jgi:hypothetical protein
MIRWTIEPRTVNDLHGPRITPRMREVISRMTDRQMLRVDIHAVMLALWLQHTDTPIVEIPNDWWDSVMMGARIK